MTETNKAKHDVVLMKIVFTLLSMLIIIFIFSRSVISADTSTAESDNVLNGTVNILSIFNINTEIINSYIIRKFAHFIEFMILGIVITLNINALFNTILKYSVYGLYTGLLVSVADETIQYFSVGRSPEVKDIVLDYLGFLTGFIITSIVIVTVKKLKRKKKFHKK